MSEITSPVVQYAGSKFRLAKWVIKHFPSHDAYIEPFCGAASILFQKTPSQLEIINDLDGNVTNFFDVLRSRTDELIRAIELTPYSRAELIRAHKPCEDSLERARRFYVMGWQKFGGVQDGHEGSWRYGKVDGGECRSPLKDWLTRCSDLPKFAKRLRNVYIECDTALEVIRRHDHPKALIYNDPPYVASTCTEDKYAEAMSDQDHIELAECLNRAQGSAIVSGYNNELYRELYSGWKMVTKQAYTIKTVGRRECLWLSPNAQANALQPHLF